MKLLRCHIENFGVLHDYDFEFNSGLTVIFEKNGFGKSTFAAFIKAMFYGLPKRGPNSVIKNERRRYDPWQGGKYGGYLEFEFQEKNYRVTRYFGKTAKDDTFEIMDLPTRKNCRQFTENLGEEIFQLDAESFSRSTYIPQLSLRNMKATDSIRSKLTNLVEDTNDLNNYETAAASLKEYRGRLKAYRGDGGSINELEARRQTLESNKFDAEEKKQSFQSVSKEIEELEYDKGKRQKKFQFCERGSAPLLRRKPEKCSRIS